MAMVSLDNSRVFLGWLYGRESLVHSQPLQVKSAQILVGRSLGKIDESAFDYCSSLSRVRFCDKVEEFISPFAMQNWWEIGCHQKSLLTYFLVKCSILEHLMGLSFMSSWQVCLYNMLGSIPTIAYGYLDAYFDTLMSN